MKMMSTNTMMRREEDVEEAAVLDEEGTADNKLDLTFENDGGRPPS